VLSEIVDHIYKNRRIKDRNQVLTSVLEREKLGSTGIGSGMAIPHARITGLEEPVIFIGISKKGIILIRGRPSGTPGCIFSHSACRKRTAY